MDQQGVIVDCADVEKHREAFAQAGATLEVEIYYDHYQDWISIRDKRLGTLLHCVPYPVWELCTQFMVQQGDIVRQIRAMRG